MSTVAAHLPPAPQQEKLYQLSVEQYQAMIRAGVITDDDPVELLEGYLVEKMLKNPPHRICLSELQRAITRLIPRAMSLQFQEPITLSDGQPEPDVSVFVGTQRDYPDRHPSAAEVALVVEIADASLARDRGLKLRS